MGEDFYTSQATIGELVSMHELALWQTHFVAPVYGMVLYPTCSGKGRA